MKRILLFLLLALFGLYCSPPEKEFFERGTNKYKSGNLKAAIQDFNKAIKYNPNFTEAFNSRGLAKYSLGDYKGAIQDYKKALQLNPNDSSVLVNLKTAENRYSKILNTNKRFGTQTNPKTNKENLGLSINSERDELAPVISPDGKTLYFVREGHPSNIGYSKNEEDQDIWFSTKTDTGTWTIAKNIGSPLNNINNNAIYAVTPDGNTLLLLGKYYNNNESGNGFSISHKTNSGWSFPENLNIANYYNMNKYVSAFLSNDGKTLLLSLQRNDSFGDLDIYVSFLEKDGGWSEPVNLGPAINTEKSETTPFLASDGVSLYFSSNGHGGYGHQDVFVARRLDSTWKNWSKPENLGPTINSAGWDGYYTIPASGDYAYFISSDNSYGKGDIFRTLLPKNVRPKPVILVSGKVINAKTKEPIEAKIFYEVLPEGKEIGTARSNPNNGNYKITLPAGKKYGFRAEAAGFISVNDNIETFKLSEYKEIERDLELVPIEIGQTVRLNNLFFDFDKSILRDESFPELDRVVKMMNENPDIVIEISGHTDDKGSIEYNQKLSEARAKAVVEYILQKNIDKKRLEFKGYGKTKPITDNDTEVGRQLNRRVEFIIIK
jgi:OmpA-OmpF porin, OOP family